MTTPHAHSAPIVVYQLTVIFPDGHCSAGLYSLAGTGSHGKVRCCQVTLTQSFIHCVVHKGEGEVVQARTGDEVGGAGQQEGGDCRGQKRWNCRKMWITFLSNLYHCFTHITVSDLSFKITCIQKFLYLLQQYHPGVPVLCQYARVTQLSNRHKDYHLNFCD